jgi:heme exporter protein CcmB
MTVIRLAWRLAAFDLSRELRRPVTSAGVLVFGMSAIVVLRLALAGSSRVEPGVLAGALWIVLLFAALLGTSRAYAAEREDGAWDALLIAPAPRAAIHLGKVISTLITTLALHLVLVSLYLALFAVPDASRLALLIVSVMVADIGLAATGVLVAALGLRARGRELLGATMFLPLAIPLVIAATALALAVWTPESPANTQQLLLFLLAYDATFFVAGLAAFPELAVE